MAFTGLSLLIIGLAGIILFLILLFFIGRMLGIDTFGSLRGFYGEKKEKFVDTTMLPDEDKFRVIYKKHNFSELISGYHLAYRDEKTGKNMLQFIYGEGKRSDFTVPEDAEYFKIGNIRKIINGKKPYEFVIDDDSQVARLKEEIDRLNLYSSGLKIKLSEFMESDKLKLQKAAEYNREGRRVLTGWSSQPQSSGYPYRPWSRPFYGGMGGEEQQE